MKAFYFIILSFVLLHSCGEKPTENKTLTDNNLTKPNTQATEDSDQTDKEDAVDVFQLFKGIVLGEIEKYETSELNLELSKEEFKYTYIDSNTDGHADLFVQASFKNSTITKDFFIIFFNDKESNGPTGFSSSSYHQLGYAEGEPSPCESCLFISKEKDIFTFKNRADNTEFKLQLISSQYGITEWKKVVNANSEESTFSIDATEAKIATITPKESELIIKDINACTVKDFDGIKKNISCFDGGTKAQECDIYYTEGKAIVGIVHLDFYNASPANPAAFDESKTNKKEMKLYFKDGDLNSIEKVLDLQDNPITMIPSLKPYWDILVEAAK